MQARLNDIFHMKPVNDIVGSVSNFRSTFQGLLRVLKSLGANIEESGCVFAHFFSASYQFLRGNPSIELQN